MERSTKAAISWLTQNLSDVPPHDNWLSKSERSILATMRFPKRRADWRLGRWTAKRALLSYFGNTSGLPEIEIRTAADGAPEAFLRNEPEPVSISISHSEGVGFCVVAPRGNAIGCDIEIVQPRSEHFVADYFTVEEREYVLQAAATEHPRLATLIWSAKESAMKALRQGLRLDTRSVVVSVDENTEQESWNPLTVRCVDSSRIFYGWWRMNGKYVQIITADRPTEQPVALLV